MRLHGLIERGAEDFDASQDIKQQEIPLVELGGDVHDALVFDGARCSACYRCRRWRRCRIRQAPKVFAQIPFGKPFFVHLFSSPKKGVQVRFVISMRFFSSLGSSFLRCLEAMLHLHILHDVPQSSTLVDIESLELGAEYCPIVVCRHISCWWRRP